jgi:hypothetical protein
MTNAKISVASAKALTKIALTNDHRAFTSGVFFDADRQLAVASDAQVLLQVPCKIDGAESFFVNRKKMDDSAKIAKINKDDEIVLHVSDSANVAFPSQAATALDVKATTVIHFNLHQLKKLIDALDVTSTQKTPIVKMTIDNALKPMKLELDDVTSFICPVSVK